MVFGDLCLNYDDFTLSRRTHANPKDGHGLAKEFVIRLEGFLFTILTPFFIGRITNLRIW